MLSYVKKRGMDYRKKRENKRAKSSSVQKEREKEKESEIKKVAMPSQRS